jgi:hypothetical protein
LTVSEKSGFLAYLDYRMHAADLAPSARRAHLE